MSYIRLIDTPLRLHSFPTRRSSDLETFGQPEMLMKPQLPRAEVEAIDEDGMHPNIGGDHPLPAGKLRLRSEEHTSELQSRLQLVCSLLLEKKNLNYLNDLNSL